MIETTITLSLPWEAWGREASVLGVHSGWVAILGGGARGRRARTEFELSGDSVFSVLRLAVRGHLVQAMVLAPFEDVDSRS